MADPVFYPEGNTPRAADTEHRVEQKILGAIRGGGSGGSGQPADGDLTAIAALTGTGIAVRTASDTWALRTLVAPAAGISIANPAGIAGDPTFALTNDLGALEGLGSTGIAVRSAADTWVQRSIAQGVGIVVTNGSGVAGNPTVALDINGLTEETVIADGDFIAIYDISAGAHRKMAKSNLVTGGGSVTTRSVRAKKSADTSINNDTTTLLTWDQEDFDTGSMHDNATNPSRLTALNAGKYIVGVNIGWDPSGTGRRYVNVRKNGTTTVGELISSPQMSAVFDLTQQLTTLVDMAANDYVETLVLQTSGGALNCKQQGPTFCFWMHAVL